MKKLMAQSLTAAALALGSLVARPAPAAETFIPAPADPSTYLEARALVSNTCSKCHGPTGNGISISPLFPILAAQQATYIELQLKQLRQRVRPDPHARAFMWGIARGLSDEQIEGVAEYFSSLPAAPSPPLTDSALAAKGKQIYESPLQLESGAVNCANCHGLEGQGKSKQAIPRLAGQHPDYLNVQVHYYRSMTRVSAIMNQVSAALTEDQIDAVTRYAASLSGKGRIAAPAAAAPEAQ
jgi:cytochrome c553